MLHCLLTVLFLLDFIKTPSAVSSGMVEELVEEEAMGEKRWIWLKNGKRMAGLTWRVQAATVVSVGGTSAVHESKEAK